MPANETHPPTKLRNGDEKRLFCLNLPDRLDRLSDVRDFIDSLDLADYVGQARLFDIKVATSEAVANAIEHAQSEVKLWTWLLNDRIIIEVINNGQFGERAEEKPSDRRRGFGLRLMVSLADEVAFIGRPRGVTKVRLTFFFDKSARSRTAAQSTPEADVSWRAAPEPSGA